MNLDSIEWSEMFFDERGYSAAFRAGLQPTTPGPKPPAVAGGDNCRPRCSHRERAWYTRLHFFDGRKLAHESSEALSTARGRDGVAGERLQQGRLKVRFRDGRQFRKSG